MSSRVVVILLFVALLGVAQAAEDGRWEEAPMDDMGMGDLPPTDGVAFDQSVDSGQMTLFMTNLDGADTSSSDVQLRQYSEFYSMDSPLGSQVEAYSVAGREPARLIMGGQAGTTMAYSSYQSAYGGANSLWIQGTSSWSQYAICPLGGYLRLLAFSSMGGLADFFEAYPNNRLDRATYNFYSGYNRISFQGDSVGRHLLFFVSNNQPSNIIIVDVVSGYLPGGTTYPTSGSARVTIRSNWLKGYNVALDNSPYRNDVSDGSLDGICSFLVTGNQYHTIGITSAGISKIYTKYFNNGYSYTLVI